MFNVVFLFSSDEKKWKDYVIKLADLQKLLKHIDKVTTSPEIYETKLKIQK